MSVTASGKAGGGGAAHAAGAEPDDHAHPLRRRPSTGSSSAPATGIRTTFFLMLLLITVFVFFSSVWLALFLSKQITRPVEALADAMDEIAAGKYDHRVARHCQRRDGRPGARVQPHGGRSGGEPAAGGELVGAVDRGQPGHRRAAPRAGDDCGDHSHRRGHAGWRRHGAAVEPRLCRADGAARGRRPDAARRSRR